MGGRRAGNIRNLVGIGGAVTAGRRELSKAVREADPEAIAGASIRLVASSQLGVSALRYGLKLALFLDRNAKRLQQLEPRARVEEIRRAWSELKRREGIQSSPELDSVVVTSASQTIRGGGGR
jgi:hypothetical protein